MALAAMTFVSPPLERLAAAWVRAHGAANEALRSGGSDEDALFDLRALVTVCEPMRSRALADLPLVARSPLPVGFGMEIHVHLGAESTPYEGWKHTLHPFVFQLRYSPSMDNQQRESFTVTIDRVGRDDEGWRVISVYDEKARAQAKMIAEMLEAQRAGRRRG